jgi:hypothetical protein
MSVHDYDAFGTPSEPISLAKLTKDCGMNDNPIVPITDSLARAIEKLFITGGFALAFGFAGLFLIIFANFAGEILKIPVFVAGCILTFSCLLFFVISSFRTRQVAKRIKDDLPLLDVLQRVTLELTDLVATTQSFAFKHLSKIQRTIETIIPLIENIPLIGQAVKDSGLADAAKLSNVIVAATDSAKTIVQKLEAAIRSGDVKEIKKYASDLDIALRTLKSALAA